MDKWFQGSTQAGESAHWGGGGGGGGGTCDGTKISNVEKKDLLRLQQSQHSWHIRDGSTVCEMREGSDWQA